MSLKSLILTASEPGHSEPAVSPYVVGAIALAILLLLLFALLAFGAGRDHS